MSIYDMTEAQLRRESSENWTKAWKWGAIFLAAQAPVAFITGGLGVGGPLGIAIGFAIGVPLSMPWTSALVDNLFIKRRLKELGLMRERKQFSQIPGEGRAW